MTDEKIIQAEKKIRQLQKALGKAGYMIGYYAPSEDGKQIDGRFYLNTEKPREMANILCEFAKQNPQFNEVVNYVIAIRSAQNRPAQPKSKLILPKMEIVK